MSLTDDIKCLALEAGFHKVGITSAEPFVEAEAAMLDRLRRGLLDGSGYASQDIYLYTHPRKSLGNARSIISVALSYLTDDTQDSLLVTGPRGWVARFARGVDYHRALRERLDALAEGIRARLGQGAEIVSFADTGPLADRSVAIRAAIGSPGKNTCVHVGEYGSWVVLGEIVTDLSLEPDDPAALDICGECDECMRACPTGAICEPYVVDMKRCLSYATQSKGFVPPSLREKLGTRIYGCDTCQSVCPLNRNATPGNVDELRPSAGLGESPELLPLLNISPREFKARVAPTTAGWIGRTRFRRNVAIALGNIGEPVAAPALVEALSDPSAVVRGQAAWALGEIGTPGARSALERALPAETSDEVKQEIRAALVRCRGRGSGRGPRNGCVAVHACG